MAEAVSAILTYGFTELALHRIEANVTDPAPPAHARPA